MIETIINSVITDLAPAMIIAQAAGAGSLPNQFSDITLNELLFESEMDIYASDATGGDRVLNSEGFDIIINKDLGKLGFFGAAPIVRPAAYGPSPLPGVAEVVEITAVSLLFDAGTPGAGTASLFNTTTSDGSAQINNYFATLVHEYNSLRGDIRVAKKLLNQIIDDLQAYGFLQ